MFGRKNLGKPKYNLNIVISGTKELLNFLIGNQDDYDVLKGIEAFGRVITSAKRQGYFGIFTVTENNFLIPKISGLETKIGRLNLQEGRPWEQMFGILGKEGFRLCINIEGRRCPLYIEREGIYLRLTSY